MQNYSDGINVFIDQPLGMAILAILIFLVLCILWYLVYRFVFFRRKALLLQKNIKSQKMIGPQGWEQQMLDLASTHVHVKLTRFNFVLEDCNQIAYKRLNRIRNRISGISTDIITVIPAARWLYDNFQMMYREIKKVRTSGTSYEILPILTTTEFKGFPRVYTLAKKMVALSGGHLNQEDISLMLNAYQKEVHLTDRELWVLPEMIGFCLLENIIEAAEDILHIIHVKSLADEFVKTNLEQGNRDITPLLRKTDMDCTNDFSFHSHVIYLLKNMTFDDGAIQKYLEYHCISKGRQLSPSSIFLEEGKIESDQESIIRSLVISLRDVNESDYEKFFEENSCLEQILSKDPDEIYAKMDSESRGLYRRIIVKLSLRLKLEEERIANACIELAREGREDLTCSHHVGTYLVGKGYQALKARLQNRPIPVHLREKKNFKGIIYFLLYIVIFIGISGLTIYLLRRYGKPDGIILYIVLSILALPMYMGITMEIINHIFTRRVRVKKFPALDYLKGVPKEARTYVVMPVIVSSKKQGMEYLERLQKIYLANPQENLYYALLVDYEDAPSEVMPKDELIEKILLNRIRELNEQYKSEYQRFSLFLRYRKWNESEQCYMCWERKRGKLEEFNKLLCGAEQEETSFSKLYCSHEILRAFKYVITLDADSNLIRDHAVKLVGLLDHPLNQPVIDPVKRRVKEGYVIAQPSVRNHITDKNGSLFAKIFGGQSGLAHYSSVVSDIYQDIFNQGIYIGKGIYHVQAFHYLFHDTIPENRVLSHDLLESCYARTVFASSALIMDTFPSSVLSFAKREHRWIRGDWQLLPWLFRRKLSSKRPVCALSKWKIFDNLRRSMVPFSKILFILCNLLFLPKIFYLWVPFVFFPEILNLCHMLISVLIYKIYRPKLVLVYKGLWKEIRNISLRAIIELVLAPYRTYIALDAVIRTLYRLCISKSKLLMWNASETVDASILNTRRGYLMTMWSSYIPSALLLLVLINIKLTASGYLLYGALILAWSLAFYLAYLISQPRPRNSSKVPEEDQELLLETARRTWQFFKDFTLMENHWLCPDNYQLSRKEKMSDKTSPTNIGLQFLSIMSARDLGFETLTSTIDNVHNLLDTVSALPKWKGHLYNWYHIRSLEVLNPAYISTVDSGNFLGHLITLKNGLLEQIDQPILSECFLSELRNILRLSNIDATLKADYTTIGDFVKDITSIIKDLNGRKAKSGENPRWCRELEVMSRSLVKEVDNFRLMDVSFNDCPTLRELADQKQKEAIASIERIRFLCQIIDTILSEVDFSFLFNKRRMLFHIGYHVDSQTLDTGCYDLMASECALTSFITVARGEVPMKHWYKLGRPLTIVKGIPCYVSWSGTMFEYLMPNLVLKEYEGSVFSETYKAAVLQHIKYGKDTGIPWGISESQYFRFDLNSNYQYKAFGIPKLRLQPVRRDPLVVTPYANLLALEYAGKEGLENLRRLKDLGMFGEYGYYEAIDYTGPDAVAMTPYCIVRSFMAHHQGMILAAINNYLNQGVFRKRFHAEPMVKATEVILEEKRQTHLISTARKGYTIYIGKIHFMEYIYRNRYVNGVAPRIPVAGYLSNNKYSLMVTSDGDGFSSYKNIMLYRFRADIYASSGNYIYIKDRATNHYWSAAYHPTKTEPAEYQAIFSPHQVEFKRRDGDIISHTAISLSPDYNMEIRRLRLHNCGEVEKQLEITSYLEVVVDSHLAELSHPAFNKLFIESEFLEEQSIFLSKRRSNKQGENPYLMHMVRTNSVLTKQLEYENDRLKFIGRNHTPENPEAVLYSLPLSNHAGFCNDPIMSLRVNIILGAGETANISFITGACSSKSEAIKIGEELNSAYRIGDIFEKFRLQREIELKYLEITSAQLSAFQDLISPIFYPSYYYRGPKLHIRRNFKNQSALWRFGISGDNPILLLQVKSIEEAGIIRDVLKAYEYLRINRVMVDLIILIEAKYGYMQEVDDLINDMTSSLRIYDSSNERPSFFILHTYEMIPAEIDLLYTVARVVFTENSGIYFRNALEEMPERLED